MNYTEKLLEKYFDIFQEEKNQPEWGVKKTNQEELIKATIPFVGKKYDQTKILLYASAENLKDYSGWLDDDSIAINRHRYFFDNYSDPENLFPDVHIAPMNNGGLINIIGYVSMKLKPNFEFHNPIELLEGVAFANFGKFSIHVNKGQKNKDYVNDFNKLSVSIPYVLADLQVLQPEILIIPITIFNYGKIKNEILNLLPQIKVIPIYQIHHFNINRKNRLQKYIHKNKEELGILSHWQSKFGKGLRGKTNDNFYSFYTYLDEVII